MFYIFTDVKIGGTFKFFSDLKTHLGLEPKFISSCKEFLETEFQSSDTLLYQKISEPGSDDAVLRVLSRPSRPRLLVVVHDYFFLCPDNKIIVHTPSFSSMAESKKSILRLASDVIFPSFFLKEYYEHFFSLPRFRVVPHIDNEEFQPLRVPPVHQKKICLAIITPLSVYKGKYTYLHLFKNVNQIFSHPIEYRLFGTSFPYLKSVVKSYPPYKEDEIYPLISECHGMLFLNHFPEMYSYALTKGINSGLPILYSDMGAVKERLERFKDPRYFPTDPSDTPGLLAQMENFIRYILEHQGTGNEIKTEFPVNIPDFYKNVSRYY